MSWNLTCIDNGLYFYNKHQTSHWVVWILRSTILESTLSFLSLTVTTYFSPHCSSLFIFLISEVVSLLPVCPCSLLFFHFSPQNTALTIWFPCSKILQGFLLPIKHHSLPLSDIQNLPDRAPTNLSYLHSVSSYSFNTSNKLCATESARIGNMFFYRCLFFFPHALLLARN